jgi:hypothetical protein
MLINRALPARVTESRVGTILHISQAKGLPCMAAVNAHAATARDRFPLPRDAGLQVGGWRPVGQDAFPYFQAMHWDIGIDFEAELHLSTSNIEDCDYNEALATVARSNHDRFLTPSRQHQHGRSSAVVTNPPKAAIRRAANTTAHPHLFRVKAGPGAFADKSRCRTDAKKSRRGRTPLRYSATPAYSLSGPPVEPDCPIVSFPTTSNYRSVAVQRKS